MSSVLERIGQAALTKVYYNFMQHAQYCRPPKRKANVYIRYLAEMKPKICLENPGMLPGQATAIATEMYRKLSKDDLADFKMKYEEQNRLKHDSWLTLSKETQSVEEIELERKIDFKSGMKHELTLRNRCRAELESTDPPRQPASMFIRFMKQWYSTVGDCTDSMNLKDKKKAMRTAYRELSQVERQKLYYEVQKDWEVYQSRKAEWVRKVRAEGKIHLLCLDKHGKPSAAVANQINIIIQSLEEQSISNEKALQKHAAEIKKVFNALMLSSM